MQATERILIIEDNEDVVAFLTDNILHPNGYSTLVSIDGQDGLRRALDRRRQSTLTGSTSMTTQRRSSGASASAA